MNVSGWLNLSAGLLRRGQDVENERFCWLNLSAGLLRRGQDVENERFWLA